MTTNVLTLEYASTRTLDLTGARGVFRLALGLSILSGLCVGVCFLTLSRFPGAVLLHVLVFGMTFFVAVRLGSRMTTLAALADDPRRRTRTVLDVLAGCGLLMIGVAPVVFHAAGLRSGGLSDGWAAALGFAYALLAGTTARHVMLYRYLATCCGQLNRERLARSLVILGWFKAVYEGLWLACCAGALFLFVARASGTDDLALWLAVMALIGAMGFAGVWIWMMIVHGMLARVAVR